MRGIFVQTYHFRMVGSPKPTAASPIPGVLFSSKFHALAFVMFIRVFTNEL